MIFILMPTGVELEPLLGMLDGASDEPLCRRPAYSGTVSGRAVRLVESGIGQVNTAQAVTALLERYSSAFVVLGGCAGGYRGTGLKVGDVAVATEEVYADLGVLTPAGWEGLEETGFPLLQAADGLCYGSLALGGTHRRSLEKAAATAVLSPADVSGDAPAVRFGKFLTVSTVSGTAERGDTLHGRFGGICENMEGAAAAHVAALYGAHFVEARGISNMVDDRDKECWDVPVAAHNCARFIAKFLEVAGID